MRIADGACSRGLSVASGASPPSERAGPSALAGANAGRPNNPGIRTSASRASVTSVRDVGRAPLRAYHTCGSASPFRIAGYATQAPACQSDASDASDATHETPQHDTKYSEYDDTTLTQLFLR